jgi:predicted dinucleotide-binding enzyme
MKIAVIGSGNIGGNLARLFIKAGHEVALANSRGPSSLKKFKDELGEHLYPMDVKDAVSYADIIVVAIHWRDVDSLPVFDVKGKIVVDTTNPYKADGSVYDMKGDISSKKVIEHFPGSKVVKAFNTIWFKHLAENGNKRLSVSERRAIPLAGDDQDAKKNISRLIEDIGFGPLDTGSLKTGSKLQGVDGVLYGKELSVREAKSQMK